MFDPLTAPAVAPTSFSFGRWRTFARSGPVDIRRQAPMRRLETVRPVARPGLPAVHVPFDPTQVGGLHPVGTPHADEPIPATFKVPEPANVLGFILVALAVLIAGVLGMVVFG
jgi:hypothetical protein